MGASRREFFRLGGAGAAAFVAVSRATAALAETASSAPVDYGKASSAEGELKIVNFDLLEADAKQMIPPGRFAFTGPMGDGWTYRENRRAFNDFPIMPRRLQGVGAEAVSLRTTLLGHELPLPVITCPMGIQAMVHTEADIASARGTGMAGSLYVLSGATTRLPEDVAAATPGPKWFQIYMNRDMEINRWLVQRARAAGFSAIVLTADALGPNQSDDFIRLGRPFPPDLQPGGSIHNPVLGGRGNFRDQKYDISFGDIAFLHEASGLPVVVKGVVHPQDIRECLAAGAAGIWVSNHGGRQMDGVPASITMLGPAVEAVAGRVPVILDSGVRRGIDVFKALAMGATAVAIGRPVLWGMICGGAPGVKSVYAHIGAELKAAMLLSGVAKVTALRREHLALKM
jgi:lactate oxidase